MQIYIPFILNVFILTFLGSFTENSRNSRFFEYIILFSLIIISAFRYNVGWDYPAYFNLASSTDPSILFTGANERIELIPKVLLYISITLENPYIFFIISSLWIIIFLYKGVKKYNINTPYSLFVFSLFPLFLVDSFSIIRQFMAISAGFYFTSDFILKNKKIKFVSGILLSFLCHRSALILIFVFPILFIINKVRISRINTYISLLSVEIFLLIINDILATRLSVILKNILSLIGLGRYTYAITFGATLGGQKWVYLNVMISISLLFFLKNRKLRYDNIFYISSIFFLLGTIAEILLTPFGHSGLRLALYYLIYLVVIFPKIIESYSGTKKVIIFLIVSYFIITLFLYTLYLDWSNYANGITVKSQYFPYKTIFFLQ